MTELTTEPAPMQESRDTYAAEEAQAILQIAIARHTEEGELSRPQLLEIAAELGISAKLIAEAEREWRLQQSEKLDRQAFNEFRQHRFQSHLLRFAITNTVFMTLNFMASDTLSWSLYILVLWGAGLGWHAWHTFYPNDHRYHDEFEKWRRRQQLKRSFNRFVDWLLGTG